MKKLLLMVSVILLTAGACNLPQQANQIPVPPTPTPILFPTPTPVTMQIDPNCPNAKTTACTLKFADYFSPKNKLDTSSWKSCEYRETRTDWRFTLKYPATAAAGGSCGVYNPDTKPDTNNYFLTTSFSFPYPQQSTVSSGPDLANYTQVFSTKEGLIIFKRKSGTGLENSYFIGAKNNIGWFIESGYVDEQIYENILRTIEITVPKQTVPNWSCSTEFLTCTERIQ